jgi:hypothetical protein
MKCESRKTCHETKDQAKREAQSLKRRHKVGKLLVYKCEECDHFHVTKNLLPKGTVKKW